MKMIWLVVLLGMGISAAAQKNDSLRYPSEKHLKNIQQLTFGGDNAEAYWSFSGKSLTFQSNYSGFGAKCDQIFWMPAKPGKKFKVNPVSHGKGRTTCSYFLPGDRSILFASTQAAGETCPPDVPREKNGPYLWPIYNEFDIYTSDLKGENQKVFIASNGYDAEATVSPTGDKIVFTSSRNGDLDLYTCNIDGSDVKQITFELGYDGGAFFSPDGKQIVFRASRPKSAEDVEKYKGYLSRGLVAPTQMEIFVCNADGSNLRQVTQLGKANWAPYFTPDGKSILFSSNHASKRGFNFNIYKINVDGSGLEQITFDGVFDSFPMFSPDGKKIVFSSNRNNKGTKDTNVFVADWVD